MADDIAEAQLRETEDKEAAMMKAVRPLHAPCVRLLTAAAGQRYTRASQRGVEGGGVAQCSAWNRKDSG